jgi:hypothetical protein
MGNLSVPADGATLIQIKTCPNTAIYVQASSNCNKNCKFINDQIAGVSKSGHAMSKRPCAPLADSARPHLAASA